MHNNDIFDDLFIFEMANNHEGSLNHGLKIIKRYARISQKYKINGAIKLQFRNLPTYIQKDYINRSDIKYINRFYNTELSDNNYFKLIKSIKKNKLITIVTPFDEISVDKIIKYDADIIKIASCSSNDWPLLEKIISTKKPIICSIGGLVIEEIDKLVCYLQKNNCIFSLLYCTSIYPTKNNDFNMSFISILKTLYPNIPIGFSTHEEPNNFDVIKIATSLGATIFEKHVGIEDNISKLNLYSANPEQTEMRIKSRKITKKILGNIVGFNKTLLKQKKGLNNLKRGLFSKYAINKGESINLINSYLGFPMQKNQISSFELDKNIISKKNYSPDQPIKSYYTSKDENNNKYKLENLIKKRTQKLIKKSNIILSNNCKYEISHHYGVEKFFETGAIIINYISNANYSKKLLIMFRGQNHPDHKHKRKNETFCVLYGNIIININGKTHILKLGDTLTVNHGQNHGFFALTDVVLEEIGTQDRNKSIYVDSNINSLNIKQRKTKIF